MAKSGPRKRSLQDPEIELYPLQKDVKTTKRLKFRGYIIPTYDKYRYQHLERSGRNNLVSLDDRASKWPVGSLPNIRCRFGKLKISFGF